MAEADVRPRWATASVRLRTTTAAVVVVAVVLVVAAFALVVWVRASLHDGVEAGAEQRAAELVQQVEAVGTPAAVSPAHPERDPDDEPADADDDPDDPEPEDLVWQVVDADGDVVAASQRGLAPLPADGEDPVRPAGAEHDYLVVVEDAEVAGGEVRVVVAASLEDVTESTEALVAPLVAGVPLVLVVVGATTWVVAGRALAPVERIRREVERISGDRLDRRVPEPPSRDEVGRLARTMNAMLARLQDSRDRQRQFVADASHELRSPLSSIRQTAEVARAHPGALPEGELAEAVLEESVRMQRLVEQLLLLTRADEGVLVAAPREVDLDDVVLTEARRLRRPGLSVDTSGVGAGRVVGDPLALGQVVRNLLDNAGRHARSRISVTLGEAGGLRAGAVELAVDDDGAGIPETQRARVFDRFARLDEARARDAGGSGLGLAIVREAVAAHGGSVVATASPLGGARFVVRLPGVAGSGHAPS